MKLTKQNYFSKDANKYYMSNSQFKGFLECEFKEMEKIKGNWVEQSQACFLQGQYIHAWNENDLDNFKKDHPELFKRDGKLKSLYEQCDEIIDFIQRDSLLMRVLSGQKEVILTADLFGIPWKICIDSYFPEENRFGDLKILKSLHDKFWNKELDCYQNVFEFRGYFSQMAIYAEIERLASGRDDYFEPFIAVVTKEKVPDKEIVSFVSEEESHDIFIRHQLNYIESNIERVKSVKKGEVEPIKCGKCDCCKSKKKLTGTIHYSNFNLY